MTAKQTFIRFQHPCGARSSSQWRQALVSLELPGIANLIVHQSGTALSITARQPSDSQVMQDASVEYMRAVATLAGRMLDVEMLDLTPSLAMTGYRWRYRIPKLVVARSSDDWDGWRGEELDASHHEKVLDRLQKDLSKQIQEWTGQSPDLGLELVSSGRPMVLKGAVSNGPKTVAAMARLDVMFTSTARIEGAFWTGLLQATGHGRIFRDGYQDNE